MVALDGRRRSPLGGSALNDIRVEGPLGEIIGPADAVGLCGEHVDEGVADFLSLLFRVGDASEIVQEKPAGINDVEIQRVVAGEDPPDLVHLAVPQHAVVHEDGRHLFPDGPVDERGGHRRVHTPGEAADHPPVADLRAYGSHGFLDEARHGPSAAQAGDAEKKVLEDLLAPGGVHHLGMELDTVDVPLLASHRSHRAGVGMGQDLEALGRPDHVVAVTHPHIHPAADTFEERVSDVDVDGGGAVLPGAAPFQLSSELLGEELQPVADPQNRYPRFEQGGIHPGMSTIHHRAGPAREHDGFRSELSELAAGDVVGKDFAVDPAFPDPAGDELGILRSEIEDCYDLTHGGSSRAFPRRIRAPARRLRRA